MSGLRDWTRNPWFIYFYFTRTFSKLFCAPPPSLLALYLKSLFERTSLEKILQLVAQGEGGQKLASCSIRPRLLSVALTCIFVFDHTKTQVRSKKTGLYQIRRRPLASTDTSQTRMAPLRVSRMLKSVTNGASKGSDRFMRDSLNWRLGTRSLVFYYVAQVDVSSKANTLSWLLLLHGYMYVWYCVQRD